MEEGGLVGEFSGLKCYRQQGLGGLGDLGVVEVVFHDNGAPKLH